MGYDFAVPLFDQEKPKGPKPLVAFRAPDDIAAYLGELKAKGIDFTKSIVTLMRLGRDAYEEAGDQWARIETYARVNDLSPGRALGKLALAGLDALERKPKK